MLGIHLAPVFETDPIKIQARLKQIGFGKNTVGYDNYIAAVPRYAFYAVLFLINKINDKLSIALDEVIYVSYTHYFF